MTGNTVELKPPKQPEHRLYVVFHGLVCLVDVGLDGFIAHFIEIGDEHDYLYGNWLVEKEIPPRAEGQDPFRAHLVGIDPGFANLDYTLNAVVPIAKPPVDTHASVRAVINLPRPRAIYQALSGPVTEGMFSDVTKLINQTPPRRVAAIRVFEYTFPFDHDSAGNEINKVALIGRDGTPLWTCPDLAEIKLSGDGHRLPPCSSPIEVAGLLKVAVLHFFDEPGDDPDDPDTHNIKEFGMSTSFLGVQLSLNAAAKVDDKERPNIPGLLPGETEPLSVREDSVLHLLLAAREGKDGKRTGGTSGTVCNGSNAQVQS